MKRLRDEHGVGGAVGQRDLLGGTVQDRDPGNDALELGAHPGDRLDRDHLRGQQLDQQTGQLPGPGGEVDDRLAALDPDLAPHPLDGLGRVAGPAALVVAAAR